jgi:phage protein D
VGSAYKLEIDGKAYTHESGVIARIESEESRDKNRVTTLVAELIDPEWELFGKVKDPAFSNVPVKLYLAKAGDTRTNQQLVFDGKATTLAVGYPDRRTFTVTAHDNSIDARRNKAFKTFKGKTSVQVAKSICDQYGFEMDTSQITANLAKLVTRSVDIGLNPRHSDWDHLQRALAADGLVAHVKGKKLWVTQAPSVVYGTVFYKDRFPVVSLNVTISHVRGPGGGGDVKSSQVFMEDKSTLSAVSGTDAKQAAKEKATAKTGRTSVAGAATKSGNMPSIEDIDGNKPDYIVNYLRKRKDTAQMVILAAPDLSVLNNIQMRGWGGKVDGTWFAENVKHIIAGGEGGTVTAVSLMRGPSPGAKKGAGL